MTGNHTNVLNKFDSTNSIDDIIQESEMMQQHIEQALNPFASASIEMPNSAQGFNSSGSTENINSDSIIDSSFSKSTRNTLSSNTNEVNQSSRSNESYGSSKYNKSYRKMSKKRHEKSHRDTRKCDSKNEQHPSNGYLSNSSNSKIISEGVKVDNEIELKDFNKQKKQFNFSEDLESSELRARLNDQFSSLSINTNSQAAMLMAQCLNILGCWNREY